MTNPNDASAIALDALIWILEDSLRADRFLGLTGLSPDGLRARIAEPAVQAAALTFLEAHEPDLVACAAARGMDPATLVAAARELGA